MNVAGLPMQYEQEDASSRWYYAAYDGQVGPLTTEQVRKVLSKFPEAERVLVWRKGFNDWSRAGAQTSRPPPPPSDEMPTWRVKWWWYPIPFISIDIGSQVGRKVMIWNSMQRRKAKLVRRNA